MRRWTMKRLLIALIAVAFLAVLTTPADADDPKAEVKAKVEAKAATSAPVTAPKDGTKEVAPVPSKAAAEKDAPPVPPVTDAKGALDVGKGAVEAAKDGRWWYFSALAVTLLLFLLKILGTKLWDFWPKMGRWRYIIPPVLSIVAALLATFQGGVSVEAAIGVFTSSYATSSLQELWEHGLLGKPRASAGG
jgi:hypothetical protein